MNADDGHPCGSFTGPGGARTGSHSDLSQHRQSASRQRKLAFPSATDKTLCHSCYSFARRSTHRCTSGSPLRANTRIARASSSRYQTSRKSSTRQTEKTLSFSTDRVAAFAFRPCEAMTDAAASFWHCQNSTAKMSCHTKP